MHFGALPANQTRYDIKVMCPSSRPHFHLAATFGTVTHTLSPLELFSSPDLELSSYAFSDELASAVAASLAFLIKLSEQATWDGHAYGDVLCRVPIFSVFSLTQFFRYSPGVEHG